MATPSTSGDDIDRLLREIKQLNAEADAVTGGPQLPSRQDKSGATAATPAASDVEPATGGSPSSLRRAAVVSAVVALLVTVVLAIPLGVVGVLLPAVLEWALAAFAGGLGVALYYSWRQRE